jgi:hypothetical protein
MAGALPFVSVLIPTYNHEQFIERSIESALAQIYPQDRVEVIVVDDASTDRTQAVIEPYLDRITYIRQPQNGGLISTMNTLYGAANGELMAVQSGDDTSPISRLAIQVEAFLRAPEIGLHYGDMVVIDADDGVIAPSYFRRGNIEAFTGRPTRQLLKRNFVAGGTIMVRRGVLESFWPMPEDAAYEDWWTALQVCQVADLDYTDAQISGYRRHESNIHHGAQGERLLATQRDSVPLMRWMAAEATCPDATGEDWIVALHRFLDLVRHVAQASGAAFEEVAPVGPERELAALEALRDAGRAWALGDETAAIRKAVAAIAHDASGESGKAALTFLAARAAAPVPTDSEARTFITLADAEELLGDPSLLAVYSDHFRDSDDASLIVTVHPDSVESLMAQAVSFGLDDPESAHVMLEPSLSPFKESAAVWASCTHAVLSERASAAPLLMHWHVGAGGMHELHELAAQRSRVV